MIAPGPNAPDSLERPTQRRSPGYQSIVRYDATRGHIYLGTRDAKTVAFLKPHRYGLELTVRTTGDVTSRQRFVIPGEVPKSRALEFIASKAPGMYWRGADSDKMVARPWAPQKKITASRLCHEIDIGKALDKSGFWAQRGRMDPKRKIAAAFFKKYPVSELAQGRHSSIRAWWTDYLTRSEYFKNLRFAGRYHYPTTSNDWKQNESYEARQIRARREDGFARWLSARRNIVAAIDLGLVPESPTAVRRFDKVSLYDLARYITHDIHRAATFARFATSVAPTFKKMLYTHNWLQARGEQRVEFDAMVVQLERLPKTARSCQTLNLAINQGLRREEFNAIPDLTVKKLETITDLLSELRQHSDHRAPGPRLNANYRPPDVPLEEGWAFADHTTFKTLSSQYSICISNVGYYEQLIAEGRAHVLFREDHKTDRGAVAFIEYGDPQTPRQMGWGHERDEEKPAWKVTEIRGFANASVHADFEREANIVAKMLTTSVPHRSPVVDQLSEGAATTERGRILEKIRALAPRVADSLATDRANYRYEPTNLAREATKLLEAGAELEPKRRRR